MCAGCGERYFEDKGVPVPPVTGAMRELAALIAAHDTAPDYAMSYGRLHIVISDGNLDDDDIAWCLDDSQDHSLPLTGTERQVGEALLRLTKPERHVVLLLADPPFWSLAGPVWR
jgi:hypothetical protein